MIVILSNAKDRVAGEDTPKINDSVRLLIFA